VGQQKASQKWGAFFVLPLKAPKIKEFYFFLSDNKIK
jgi:hypothetical protein